MALEIIKVTSIALGFLYYSGWGLALIILPTRLQRRAAYLLMPLVGLAVGDSIGDITSFVGLTGRLTVPRIFKHGSHDSTDLLLRAGLYWPDTGERLPVI